MRRVQFAESFLIIAKKLTIFLYPVRNILECYMLIFDYQLSPYLVQNIHKTSKAVSNLKR